MTFTEKVLTVVRTIPRGQVLTYKKVAQLAGNIKAARTVGSIMAKNKDLTVPCHRVIRSDGRLGGYNGLKGKSKEQLLNAEDAEIFPDNFL